MGKRTLLGNALSLGIVQIVNLALPLLWLPYLSRVLGAEQLGRVAFAIAVAQILVILTDYGFNLSASKAIAVYRHDVKRVAEIWSAVTAARAILAITGIVVILIASLIFERAREELGLYLAAYAMVIGNVLYPQWLFQGLEKLKLISFVQVIARVIILALIMLIVKSERDVYWAAFLQAGGMLLGGILAAPVTFRALDRQHIRWPSRQVLVAQFKDGWHVFLSTSAISLYTTANTFFLGLLIPPVALGYYHVAEKIIRASQSIYGAVGNAIYPYASRLALVSTEALLTFNKRLIFLLTMTAFMLALGLYLVAPYAVTLLFGEAYLPSAKILQVFTPILVIVVASNVFGMQTMLPLGMEKIFGRILIFASFFNFGIFIPAAYYFGAHGAAWANLAVESFVTLSMLFILHRLGKNPISFKRQKDTQ